MQNEFDNEYDCEDGHIRSFEEFDEKLPNVAKVIVRRGIDFTFLTNRDDEEETPGEFEAGREVCQSISAILREMVECTSDMTVDEFGHYFDVLLTACELVVLVNGGLVYEKKGKFFLTPEGESHCQKLEACEESSD